MLLLHPDELNWFCLDDNVMGGQSQTNITLIDSIKMQLATNNTQQSLTSTTDTKLLQQQQRQVQVLLPFSGIINTNGGGFASVRTVVPNTITLTKIYHQSITHEDNSHKEKLGIIIKGFRIRYRGDGKTYKFICADGTRHRASTRKPSWQYDIPTRRNICLHTTTEHEQQNQNVEYTTTATTA
jgi:Complex I intermediate-associated protein 30 (CIA30)